MTHDNFRDFVESKWDKEAPLMPHLNQLAADLQEWNKTNFHNIFKKKHNLLARIAGVQRALALQKARDLIKLESKLSVELDEVLALEELLWYQKSRVEWNKDGDHNTTLFQLSTIARRWRNKILAIKEEPDGQWLTDKAEVQNNIVNYFTTLFESEDEQPHEDLPRDIFPEFTTRDRNNLTRPFLQCEIDRVMKEMGALKAPVPDGFQVLFYQKNWDLVSQNVYKLVFDVLNGKGMPQSLNDTALVLISKVDNPEVASNFEPLAYVM
ncbi:uncharacterized protein LOC110703874 [Chenopodium quinoa]|uniref:uncharacterized protein LOC110703874 n=1 Tax=Chenopodium quinoa TaxID=63459 RepID=UPI000B793CC0|nr:uncharacterized protein LOC110703874 [Chenopodium quinoa]